MTTTRVLLFHPNLSRSRANAALAGGAKTVPGVEVVDMARRFADGRIDLHKDAEAEAEMLLGTDRIVLQFPIQWYSTPPLLKVWQDAVLTRMYYIHPDTEGDRLSGTPLMVAATAGNSAAAYARDGQNFYLIDEIMTPLKATAHRCGLPWHDPYIVYRADKMDDDELEENVNSYVLALGEFTHVDAHHSGREVA